MENVESPGKRKNPSGKERIPLEKGESPWKRENPPGKGKLSIERKNMSKNKNLLKKKKSPLKREDARRLASPGNNYEKVI
nr:hypothetical protein [uncultured Acetatifactor sp.]